MRTRNGLPDQEQTFLILPSEPEGEAGSRPLPYEPHFLSEIGVLALPALKRARIPISRNDYLGRRAKLWSLVQSVNPETANLEEIAAEKAALDAYELEVSASATSACGEGVGH